MYQRFLAACLLAAACGQLSAAVDVNAADEAALRSVKGIGPAKARAILDERARNGPFDDASDLAARVKGFGGRTLERLQAEGLSVGRPLSVPSSSPPPMPVSGGVPSRAASAAARRAAVAVTHR
jgi:competence protein ComEA